MTYKTNYELWNTQPTTRRPSQISQMSEIDAILSQTYPHVAMLPYMQCQHCNYEEPDDEQPSSPSSFASTFSSSSSSSSSTFASLRSGWTTDSGNNNNMSSGNNYNAKDGTGTGTGTGAFADSISPSSSSNPRTRWLCMDIRKRSTIRRRLRQLLKRPQRS